MYGVGGGWGQAAMGDMMTRFTADTTGLQAGIQRASAALNSFSANMVKVGGAMYGTDHLLSNMARAWSAPIIEAGKRAIDFQHELNEVSSIMSGEGSGAAQRYRKDLLDLSRTMGVDLKDATESLYSAISAGIPKNNVMDFLKSSAVAARAGLTDLESSSQALRTIIKAYNVDLNDATKNYRNLGESSRSATDALGTFNAINDILLKGMAQGNFRYKDLANSIGKVAETAADAKVPLDQLMAIVSNASKQLSVEEITSGFNNLIRTFTSPTAKSLKFVDDLNIKLGLVGEKSIELSMAWMGRQGGLLPALDQLNKAVGGSAEGWNQLTNRQQGARLAFITTSNNMQDVNQALAENRKATGAGAEMAATMTDEFQRLKNAANNLHIIMMEMGTVSLGKDGVVNKGLRMLNDRLERMSKLIEAAPEMRTYFTLGAGGIALAAGGLILLSGVIGRLLLSMALFKYQFGLNIVNPIKALKNHIVGEGAISGMYYGTKARAATATTPFKEGTEGIKDAFKRGFKGGLPAEDDLIVQQKTLLDKLRAARAAVAASTAEYRASLFAWQPEVDASVKAVAGLMNKLQGATANAAKNVRGVIDSARTKMINDYRQYNADTFKELKVSYANLMKLLNAEGATLKSVVDMQATKMRAVVKKLGSGWVKDFWSQGQENVAFTELKKAVGEATGSMSKLSDVLGKIKNATPGSTAEVKALGEELLATSTDAIKSVANYTAVAEKVNALGASFKGFIIRPNLSGPVEEAITILDKLGAKFGSLENEVEFFKDTSKAMFDSIVKGAYLEEEAVTTAYQELGTAIDKMASLKQVTMLLPGAATSTESYNTAKTARDTMAATVEAAKNVEAELGSVNRMIYEGSRAAESWGSAFGSTFQAIWRGVEAVGPILGKFVGETIGGFIRASGEFELFTASIKLIWSTLSNFFGLLKDKMNLEASFTALDELANKAIAKIAEINAELAKKVKIQYEIEITNEKETADKIQALMSEESMRHPFLRFGQIVVGMIEYVVINTVESAITGLMKLINSIPGLGAITSKLFVSNEDIDKTMAAHRERAGYLMGTNTNGKGEYATQNLWMQDKTDVMLNKKIAELQAQSQNSVKVISDGLTQAHDAMLHGIESARVVLSDFAQFNVDQTVAVGESWKTFSYYFEETLRHNPELLNQFIGSSEVAKKQIIENLFSVWPQIENDINNQEPKMSIALRDMMHGASQSMIKPLSDGALEAINTTTSQVHVDAAAMAGLNLGRISGEKYGEGVKEEIQKAGPSWYESMWSGLKSFFGFSSPAPMVDPTAGIPGGEAPANNAMGTNGASKKGQWSWVGEQGRELAWLPAGSRVIPNGKSNRIVKSLGMIPGYAGGTNEPDYSSDGNDSGDESTRGIGTSKKQNELLKQANLQWQMDYERWLQMMADQRRAFLQMSAKDQLTFYEKFLYDTTRMLVDQAGLPYTQRNASQFRPQAQRMFSQLYQQLPDQALYTSITGKSRPSTKEDAVSLKANGFGGSFSGNEKLDEFERQYGPEIDQALSMLSPEQRKAFDSYANPAQKLQFEKQLLKMAGVDTSNGGFAQQQQLDAILSNFGPQIDQLYNNLTPAQRDYFDRTSNTTAGRIKNMKSLLDSAGINYNKVLKDATGAYSASDGFSAQSNLFQYMKRYGKIIAIAYDYLSPSQKALYDKQVAQGSSAALSAAKELVDLAAPQILKDFMSANKGRINLLMSQLSPQQMNWLKKAKTPADTLLALMELMGGGERPEDRGASPYNIYGELPPVPGPMKVEPGGFGDNVIATNTGSAIYPSLSGEDVAAGTAIVGTTNGEISSFRGDPLAMSRNFKSAGAKSTFAPAVPIYNQMVEILKRSGALPDSGNPLDSGLMYHKFQPTDRNGKPNGSAQYDVTATPAGLSKADALTLARLQDDLMRILAASLAEEKKATPKTDTSAASTGLSKTNSAPPVVVKQAALQWNISDNGKFSYKMTKGDSFSAQANLFAFIKLHEKDIITAWNKLNPEQQALFYQSATNARTTLASLKALLKMFGFSTTDGAASGVSKTQAAGVVDVLKKVLSGDKVTDATATTPGEVAAPDDSHIPFAQALSTAMGGGLLPMRSNQAVSASGITPRSMAIVTTPTMVLGADAVAGVEGAMGISTTTATATRNQELAAATRAESDKGLTPAGTSMGSFQKIGLDGNPIPRAIPTEQVVLGPDGSVVGKPGDTERMPTNGFAGGRAARRLESIPGNKVETRNVKNYWLPEALRSSEQGGSMSDFYKWFYYLDDERRYNLLVNLVGDNKASRLDFSASPYAMATFIYKQLISQKVSDSNRYRYMASKILDKKELANVKKHTYTRQWGSGKWSMSNYTETEDAFKIPEGTDLGPDPIPDNLNSEGQPPGNRVPMSSGGSGSGGSASGGSNSSLADTLPSMPNVSPAGLIPNMRGDLSGVQGTNVGASANAVAGSVINITLSVGQVRSDDQIKLLAEEVVNKVKRLEFRSRK